MRVDTLPERYPYFDNGCEVAPKCLQCPLAQCKYDNLGWQVRDVRRRRDEAVRVAYAMRKCTTAEIAAQFHISKRTMYRIIAVRRSG